MATSAQIGKKAPADAYREQYPDALCSDDARLKTVTFTSESPSWSIDQAELGAMDTRDE